MRIDAFLYGEKQARGIIKIVLNESSLETLKETAFFAYKDAKFVRIPPPEE
jgi:hypothetical protein